MRIHPKLLIPVIFCVFLVVPAPHAAGGELIQPTRTLKSAEKLPGELSVFSEPSGLDVFLNHLKIGKSPILSMKVTPGTYSLKVGDSKTRIDVLPGKSLRLSLFKGAFITLKAKEKESIQKPETETAEKKPAESAQKQKEYQPQYDPGYWPLKPNGPIK
jgi:PEGA domain